MKYNKMKRSSFRHYELVLENSNDNLKILNLDWFYYLHETLSFMNKSSQGQVDLDRMSPTLFPI